MKFTPWSAAVLIAALGLLGALVWLKVDGAVVAALGAVAILVQSFAPPTIQPGSKGLSITPPPNGDRDSEVK